MDISILQKFCSHNFMNVLTQILAKKKKRKKIIYTTASAGLVTDHLAKGKKILC